MKIRRQKRSVVRRLAAGIVVCGVAVGSLLYGLNTANATQLNKNYTFIKSQHAVPSSNVAWVAPSGNDSSGNGSEGSPYATFAKALSAVKDGGTVVAKSGIYREAHFYITKNNITLQAAPGAEVWLKGSDVATNWVREGNLWKSTGNYQNFCHVCTVNADPSVEGVAAYPEQVFIDDKPLAQVANKNEVTAGKFFVQDNTPTTLKVANNNTAGYNVGRQDSVTYYVGSDPTAGTTEISQRTRAFTAVNQGFSLKGINIAQYAPNQVWGFKDPVLGDLSGPVAVSINGRNAKVQDAIIAQNSSTGLFFDSAAGSTVTNSRFLDNGGTGLGANRAHGSTFEGNTFSRNNAAGFETVNCGAYCTVSDIKVTHAENTTFRGNTIDNAGSPVVSSRPEVVEKNSTPGFWCDEGCINTNITNNFFVNTPIAIFYEVSSRGTIASNIIEGAGTGIRVSSSDSTKLYNNTISRSYRPIYLFEDSRSNGCNAARNGRCIAPEQWSQSKGLSWKLTQAEIYNNIVSSRAWDNADKQGSEYKRAYAVRIEGAKKQDGSTVDANQMVKGIDYNAYYRDTKDTNFSVWDLQSRPGKTDTVYKAPREIQQDAGISPSVQGKEVHSLDLMGSQVDNPHFVKEAAGNREYNTSNYQLKGSSAAKQSGTPLPQDVARAIDPTGQKVKAGVAVDRGALVNPHFSGNNIASSQQTTPQSSQPQSKTSPSAPTKPSQPQQSSPKNNTANKQKDAVVAVPDTNLRAAINRVLARTTHKQRSADQQITAAEMNTVTGLDLNLPKDAPNSKKVADLTGLEAAHRLDWLSVDNNNLTTLQPIAELTQLTSLTAFGNKIQSLDSIAKLTKLKLIRISGNPIRSTKPLVNLSELRYLSLSGGDALAEIDIADITASAPTLKTLSTYDYSHKTKLAHTDLLQRFTALKRLRLGGIRLTNDDKQAVSAIKPRLDSLDTRYN